MNKNEFVSAIAEKSGLSKSDAGKAIDGMVSVVSETLASGDEIRLTGFGTFSVAERAAGKGRNPSTGEEIDIPASKRPKFTAGKPLKDAVKKG